LKTENKNLSADEAEINDLKNNFVVGDFVNVRNSSAAGRIIEINKSKQKATIISGTIKMQVNLFDLIMSKEKKVEINKNDFYNFGSTNAKMRIDIRGEKPELAEFIIVKFLDEAYQSSLERVEILHGKGTGALKKTVWEILKLHEKIKSFYFAPIEFGGEGITIAEIK
jgi:DNA mismatch repair protein MutS2